MPQKKPEKPKPAEKAGKAEPLSESPEAAIFKASPQNLYKVRRPKLSASERKFAKGLASALKKEASLSALSKALKGMQQKQASEFRQKVLGAIEQNEMTRKLPEPEQVGELKENLTAFIKAVAPFVKNINGVVDYVVDSVVGYDMLSPMLRDAELEEVMVNSPERGVFVFHRKHGMCKTDVAVSNEFIAELCSRIAKTAHRRFDIHNPLLDARLPDGNRVNATFPYVTPAGYSLTVRKFTQEPISVIELIKRGTLSAELVAFLWTMIDGLNVQPANIIVAGGAGAGKTTTLSALSTFIRESQRIITIEDTIELRLGKRENWVQMEARLATKEAPEVTMDELLQNSLRMRPDRLIVGEVRGKEAQTMFTAMDVGHSGILGTVHANSARETILRLKSLPMNVPESMLPLIDLIVVQTRIYTKDRGLIRRAAHVAEVTRMHDQVLLANIFELDPKHDSIKRTNIPIGIIEPLAERAGISKKELMREIDDRESILNWIVKEGITSSEDADTIIQNYYKNPEAMLTMARGG